MNRGLDVIKRVGESETTRLRLVTDAQPHEDGDVQLVLSLCAGHPGATRAIWDRYQPLVHRILTRALGPGADVDDLVQEAFIRLYRSAPRLQNGGALRGLVLTIATRVIQQELRSRWLRRWIGLVPSETIEAAADETVDPEAREALARFYQILNRLPPKQRTVFVLRHIEDLELTEVADALAVSLSTAKRWIARATDRVMRHAGQDPVLHRYLAASDKERPDGQD